MAGLCGRGLSNHFLTHAAACVWHGMPHTHSGRHCFRLPMGPLCGLPKLSQLKDWELLLLLGWWRTNSSFQGGGQASRSVINAWHAWKTYSIHTCAFACGTFLPALHTAHWLEVGLLPSFPGSQEACPLTPNLVDSTDQTKTL